MSINISNNYTLFLVCIILMSAVGPMATDIYLPALPEMADYFACSQTQIQASFTVFLLGLAVCQLLAGFLSDYFGRKKITLFGLSLFIIATVCCTFATTLSQFILFRILQAVGGGVGSVVGRAIVADRYNKKDMIKILTTTFPIIGMTPAVAPFIGGYLTKYFGWQAPFIFVALFGAVALLIITICLKDSTETTRTDSDNINGDINGNVNISNNIGGKENKENVLKPNKKGFGSVLLNFEFLGYVFVICSSFCAFRSYTIESPFVFNNQGYLAAEIGHFYIALALSHVVGCLMVKKLVSKFSMQKTFHIGFLFFVPGALCMIFASHYWGNTSPYSIIIPMSFVSFGSGFLFPIASAAALASVPALHSGLASGVIGVLQQGTAAMCVNWVGEFCSGEALPMSMFISIIVTMGLGSYLIMVVSRPRIISWLDARFSGFASRSSRKLNP